MTEQVDSGFTLPSLSRTVNNGFVTLTFKVKRNRIEEFCATSKRWVGSGRGLWALIG